MSAINLVLNNCSISVCKCFFLWWLNQTLLTEVRNLKILEMNTAKVFSLQELNFKIFSRLVNLIEVIDLFEFPKSFMHLFSGWLWIQKILHSFIRERVGQLIFLFYLTCKLTWCDNILLLRVKCNLILKDQFEGEFTIVNLEWNVNVNTGLTFQCGFLPLSWNLSLE